MTGWRRALGVVAALCLFTPLPGLAATLTHVAVGEVTTSTAVVWARCDAAGTLHVRSANAADVTASVTADRDFTQRVALTDLAAATTYRYEVACDPPATRVIEFRTAPAPDQPRAVRFAWSGDVGGQNVCRDTKSGYAIFDRIGEQQPSFFVALGDMIYADDPCKPRGRYGNDQLPGLDHPAVSLADFWAVWRYHRSDVAFQRFLERTPMVPIWDDHETLNDSGPHRDTYSTDPGTHLLTRARQAFLDYQPLVPPMSEPTRLYRSARWGKHLELFILDTRQYRGINEAPDDPQQPKSLLGETQRRWLTDGLSASDATWKIVVSSVPLSIPTCFGGRGCDGWANGNQNSGFEQEIIDIMKTLRTARVRNMVWLTTDVHFATGFHYTPFADDRDFTFSEFVAGPLNAGVFPQNAFDLTLGAERLFFYGPSAPTAIASFDALRQWLNFGVVAVDDDGDLAIRIINGNGKVVAEQQLTPR